MSVITVQVGQCGNQVGASLFAKLADEAEAGPDEFRDATFQVRTRQRRPAWLRCFQLTPDAVATYRRRFSGHECSVTAPSPPSTLRGLSCWTWSPRRGSVVHPPLHNAVAHTHTCAPGGGKHAAVAGGHTVGVQRAGNTHLPERLRQQLGARVPHLWAKVPRPRVRPPATRGERVVGAVEAALLPRSCQLTPLGLRRRRRATTSAASCSCKAWRAAPAPASARSSWRPCGTSVSGLPVGMATPASTHPPPPDPESPTPCLRVA